jgi:hypothetical protein
MNNNHLAYMEALNYTANIDRLAADHPPLETDTRQHRKVFDRSGRRNAIFLPNDIKEAILSNGFPLAN